MKDTTKGFIIVFLFFPCFFFGQTEQEENAYYKWFDNVLGQEHTGLYNGTQYIDLDINRILNNKHAFFQSDKVLNGSVVYDDQTYYDIGMKYNLETDRLLVTLKPGAVASILRLIHDKISEFTIDGNRFIKINDVIGDNTKINGYHEVLLETKSLALYKRNEKRRKKKFEGIRGNKLYYEFISSKQYILFVEGIYKPIKGKSDIIKIFPDHKKEIKSFYETNKKLRKSDPDRFMQRLFTKNIQSSSKNEA